MAATLLICDDQPALRDLARAALDQCDYEIVEAHDGDESLEVARRVRPDLVVLDLVMPGRSGLDVLAELRRDPALSGTPVIVCTAARTMIDDRPPAEGGADRYLQKPFGVRELAAAVEELLGGRQS